MVKLFYTSYMSVDLAHDELLCAKVGKGAIKKNVLELLFSLNFRDIFATFVKCRLVI